MRQFLRAMGYAFSALLVYLLAIVPSQLADPDLWGRFSVAALLFENHRFPYRDVFSFTAGGQPWIDHEWLSGVVFYGVMWLGGEAGLHLLKYGLIGATFLLLFLMPVTGADPNRRTPKRMNPDVTLLALVFGMPLLATAFYPTIRAQMFSLLFFVGTLWVLESVRQGERNKLFLFWLAPVLVVWANAHGGFILGILLLWIYAVGEGSRYHSLKGGLPYVGVAMLAVLLIGLLNPYGFAYWPFILHALSMPRPLIGEWNAMPLLSMDYWPIKALMAGLVVLAAWVWLRKRDHWSELVSPFLVLGFCVLLTLKGVRFKAFLLLATLAYLPLFWATLRRVGQASPEKVVFRRSLKALLPWGLAGIAICLLVLSFSPTSVFKTRIQDENNAQARGLIPFPVGVVQYLRHSPLHGNLLNPFTPGEFLYWALYPRFKVAWDGRYEEVYPDRTFAAIRWFYAYPHQHESEAYRAFIERSGASLVLLDALSPNLGLMRNNEDWEVIYQDSFYYLFTRRGAVKRIEASAAEVDKKAARAYTLADFFQPADLQRFKTP